LKGDMISILAGLLFECAFQEVDDR